MQLQREKIGQKWNCQLLKKIIYIYKIVHPLENEHSPRKLIEKKRQALVDLSKNSFPFDLRRPFPVSNSNFIVKSKKEK